MTHFYRVQNCVRSQCVERTLASGCYILMYYSREYPSQICYSEYHAVPYLAIEN